MIISNMMLQTMGLAREASLVAGARQGMFFLPAVLLLPSVLGLLGVQLSQTVSDTCSLLLTVPLTLRVLRDMKREEERLAGTGGAAAVDVPV
jgi:Na+-driven multidrug efflux pump